MSQESKSGTSVTLTKDDQKYLEKAFESKASLTTSPLHTNFRVFALILFKSLDGELDYVCGTNTESTLMGTSICAERMAIGALRLKSWSKIVSLYLVSDSPTELVPGLLCREYLCEFISLDTPIVLGSLVHGELDASAAESPIVYTSSGSPGFRYTSRTVTLRHLYPHPPIFRGYAYCDVEARTSLQSNAQDIEQWLRDYTAVGANVATPSTSAASSSFCPSSVPPDAVQRLYTRAKAALQSDNREHVLPGASHRYAAAALFPDGFIAVAAQSKLLEFGHSIDPVTALYVQALAKRDSHNARDNDRAADLLTTSSQASASNAVDADSMWKPVLIVQVDGQGILHPPFAPARAHFAEGGCEQTRFLFHAPAVLANITESASICAVDAGVASTAAGEKVAVVVASVPEETRPLVRVPSTAKLSIVCVSAKELAGEIADVVEGIKRQLGASSCSC